MGGGGEDVGGGHCGEDVEFLGVDLAEVADYGPVLREEGEDFIEGGGVNFGADGDYGSALGGFGGAGNEAFADVTFGVEEVDEGFAMGAEEFVEGSTAAVGVNIGEVGGGGSDAVFEHLGEEEFGSLPLRCGLEEIEERFFRAQRGVGVEEIAFSQWHYAVDASFFEHLVYSGGDGVS